jgi:hypothetical protein
MSVDLYQLTAPVFVHNLKNLSVILKKAAKSAKARGIEPAVLLNGRLAPDMFPLLRQVQIVTDNAKGCCSRLTGTEAPVFEDGDADFAQLNQRINDTIKFIKGLKKHQFPDNADEAIEMRVPIGVLHFNCEDYVKGWAFPNFYFHLTTAYNILRHNGVEIGKADFLGMVPGMTATGKIAKMMGLPTGQEKSQGCQESKGHIKRKEESGKEYCKKEDYKEEDQQRRRLRKSK